MCVTGDGHYGLGPAYCFKVIVSLPFFKIINMLYTPALCNGLGQT